MSDGNDAADAAGSPGTPASQPAPEIGVRLLRRPLVEAPGRAAAQQPDDVAGPLKYTGGRRAGSGDYSVRAEWRGVQCTGTGRSAKDATLSATQGILLAVAQSRAPPPSAGACPAQPAVALGEEAEQRRAHRAEAEALRQAHRGELDALRRAQREEAGELARVHRAEASALRRALGRDASADAPRAPAPARAEPARVASSGPRGRRTLVRCNAAESV